MKQNSHVASLLLHLAIAFASPTYAWIAPSARKILSTTQTFRAASSSQTRPLHKNFQRCRQQNNCRHTSLRMAKELYNIAGSGWASPRWNWGSAMGTGHDCAAICRQKYGHRKARQDWVDQLLESEDPFVENPEELKLVLGLCFQNGRWDGSDGGRQGYAQVLSTLAQAERYEVEPVDVAYQNLVQDLVDRYPLVLDWLDPEDDERRVLLETMNGCLEIENKVVAFQRATGLVLLTMGFIQKGL